VDGADEVRRAVREQLRRGATQIKLLASGGIVSPTDPFDSVQFSAGEIAAAVEVAAGWHTYVLAHCHTSPTIDVAIANGVRSIEHGTMLEEATARRMQELGVYMVPTLQTIDKIVAHPNGGACRRRRSPDSRRSARTRTAASKLADELGVSVASGSDVVGPVAGSPRGGARDQGRAARRAQGDPERDVGERGALSGWRIGSGRSR
jgi:imidazolonepropionase-like amidohydrolase